MINYFKELLQTLKEINRTNKQIEQHLSKLSSCVQDNRRRHGVRNYISSGHWNDDNY